MESVARNNFKRVLIVGASSGIGAELVRQWAAKGCTVALVARREAELNSLAETIRAASGTVFAYPHDVTHYDEVPALFQQICRDLGGLDVIVYAAGAMPRITEDEYNFAKDKTIIDVNVLGAVAWLNEAAVRFAATGDGTIVGIGSVAGERGRRGQPVYCTSKAALNTYLEALRNRLGRLGVRVVTIKPGPVDTPLTQDLDKLPLMISAPVAAEKIIAAAESGTRVAYVPGIWRLIMGILCAIPSPIFQKMNI